MTMGAGAGRLWEVAAWFKDSPRWALLMAAACAGGVAYGAWYYVPQLARTPLLLWPFAPDSPLAVLWALLAILLHQAHRRAGGEGERPGVAAATVDALAFVANLQVGAWSVYVLVRYADAFNTFSWSVPTLLLVSHAGMILLAFVFLDGIRKRYWAQPRAQAIGVAVAAAFYLLQDALDYFGPDFMGRGCGMRPHTVPCDPALEMALAWITFSLTIVTVGVAVAAMRARPAS